MQKTRFPIPKTLSDTPETPKADNALSLSQKLYDLMVREDMFLPYLQIQISGAWRNEGTLRKYYERARRFDFPLEVFV